MCVFPQLQSRSVGIGVSKCFLQGAEEATSAWNGKNHGSELANDLVPDLHRDMALCRCDCAKDIMELLDSVWWQLDGHVDGVCDPTKHHVLSGPCGISFPQLFGRSWFLSMRVVVCMQFLKDTVQCME